MQECYRNQVHLKCNSVLNYKLSLKYYKSSPLLVPQLQHVGKSSHTNAGCTLAYIPSLVGVASVWAAVL